jgi:amidohydrolase
MASFLDYPEQALLLSASQWRRDIHEHPELGYQEIRTSDIVARELISLGLEVTRGVGSTGVIGTLRRGSSSLNSKVIGLRADMDALPMMEIGDQPHASKHAGCMHACGHDGHTAILLATAHHLSNSDDFEGCVHFIFQPAEETGAGAQKMIEDGLFEKFPMDAVYGLHNWPGLPVGTVGVNAGAMMASQDTFDITIHGAGSHAAMPEQGVDPIVTAAYVVTALQPIVSRRISPFDPAVLSVTMLEAGSAYNVIPHTAVIRGTVRCVNKNVRNNIREMIFSVAETVSMTYGATASVSFKEGYPVTVNDPKRAQVVHDAAVEVLGTEHVVWNGRPSMASEDFSYMLQACPGAYFWLGADGNGTSHPLHHPRYDFNDDLIPLGVKILCRILKLEGLCSLSQP